MNAKSTILLCGCTILLLTLSACTSASQPLSPTPTLLVLEPTPTPACEPGAVTAVEAVYHQKVIALSHEYTALMDEIWQMLEMIDDGDDRVLIKEEWQRSILALSVEAEAKNIEFRTYLPSCRLVAAHTRLLEAVTGYDYMSVYIERAIVVGDPDIIDGARRELKRSDEKRADALTIMLEIIEK